MNIVIIVKLSPHMISLLTVYRKEMSRVATLSLIAEKGKWPNASTGSSGHIIH